MLKLLMVKYKAILLASKVTNCQWIKYVESTDVYVIAFHGANDYNEGETIVSIVALEGADKYVVALERANAYVKGVMST